MKYINEYESWLNNPNIDKDLKRELESLECEKEIQDRFYKKLEFGTAGIRGVLGVGTNRMNLHTVAEVAKGLACKVISEDKGHNGIVIGYDVRNMSKEFAELSAAIFLKEGIKVYLFDFVTATPILSYAVREMKAAAGIMITASHNPKEYNGYKVYGENGIQILQEDVNKIKKFINSLKNPFSIENYKTSEEILYNKVILLGNEFIDGYMKKVMSLSINKVESNMKVVYSPLHGAGSEFVEEILISKKMAKLSIVKEQRLHDSSFTTVPYPNPEEESVFEYSKKLGTKINAELLLTTDPDADRVGAMVLHNGKYQMMSGNNLGTILTFYILSQLSEKKLLKKNSAIIKTIVTDNLVDKIAEKFGVKVYDVHVGFKNIYSLVEKWEKTGEAEYILGYEESYGFGIGSKIARDKDAISASMLIVEMAAYYHNLGKTLIDVLNEIYEEHGYHEEYLKSISLEGIDGKREMDNIVSELRNSPIENIFESNLVKSLDYLKKTNLEKMDVLKYIYEDGTWFVVRPSGTEPKLKLYIYTVSKKIETGKADSIANKIENLIVAKKNSSLL